MSPTSKASISVGGCHRQHGGRGKVAQLCRAPVPVPGVKMSRPDASSTANTCRYWFLAVLNGIRAPEPSNQRRAGCRIRSSYRQVGRPVQGSRPTPHRVLQRHPAECGMQQIRRRFFSLLPYQNAIPEVAEQESAQICTLKRILKDPQSPEN
jgi:hypothetical protein